MFLPVFVLLSLGVWGAGHDEEPVDEGLGEVVEDGEGVQGHELFPTGRVHLLNVRGVGPETIVHYTQICRVKTSNIIIICMS